MQRHKLYWVALCFMTLALVAAAPLAAFCDDVTEIDTGSTPVGNIPGLHQGLAAHQYSYQDSYYLGLAFFKAVGDDYAVSVRFLNNGQYQNLGLENSSAAISCPENPTQAVASISHMPEDPERSVVVVGGICQGAAVIAVIAVPLNNEPVDPSTWRRKQINNPFGAINAPASLSWPVTLNDSWTIGDRLCLTMSNGSVQCYDLSYGGPNPAQPQEYTVPSGMSPMTGNLNHTIDAQGNMHTVSTDPENQLNYYMYPAGSTQANAGSFKNLNLASQNKSWKWTQVRVAPNGTVYVSAYNPLEGSLYVFYKASDSADHWFFRVFSSSDGPMGMFNSMAVDNQTNNAVCSFADSQGHTCVLIVKPDGSSKLIRFDSKYGSPHSTAATAGDGKADIFSLNDIERTMNPGLFQFGVRVNF